MHHGRLEDVKRLLSEGAPINHKNPEGSTPVLTTAMADYLDIVTFLISKNATVNIDFSDRTPETTVLHSASRHQTTKIAEIFLDLGADINALKFQSNTPVMLAVELRNLELLDLLIERDADLSIPNNSGWAPIHRATVLGYECLKKVGFE